MEKIYSFKDHYGNQWDIVKEVIDPAFGGISVVKLIGPKGEDQTSAVVNELIRVINKLGTGAD